MITVSGFVEPFKSRTSNFLDITNEWFVILTLYTFICFTDFVADKRVQNLVGKGLIVIISLSICINLTIILIQNTLLLARDLKIGWLKLKQKWALEERN